MAFADIEQAAKAWAIATPEIAARIFDGVRYNAYTAMPAASPRPSLIIQRVGGGPVGRGDLPQDMARISFDCWGADRPTAFALSAALCEALDMLGSTGGFTHPGVRLETAEIALWTWAPEIRIDYPRYIVDARIWSLRTPA